ncbi:hypothetical protein F1880_003455 [Penicillium rolfsii]|nr:hypothetical protein F1880_003455 [Penicillium rolfsii]
MFFSKIVILLASHLALSSAAGCGKFDACVGTETCTTATFTTPTATTVTTCVPTATCLGVYSNCYLPDNTIGNCCSGYCAASKCRSTDQKWPYCQEDNGPCFTDENCCYSYRNKCVNGICTRPQVCGKL